jgi:hypothetical protein
MREEPAGQENERLQTLVLVVLAGRVVLLFAPTAL